MEASTISFYKDDKPYEQMSKTELIKVIESLDEQIEKLEDQMENLEEKFDRLGSENEHYSRSLSDYEKKEKEERIYELFPHMRPLWKKDL